MFDFMWDFNLFRVPAQQSLQMAGTLRFTREPFNLSNTADREAHKERPQCPMTASSAQAQHSPLPDVFKRKEGRGNNRSSSQ